MSFTQPHTHKNIPLSIAWFKLIFTAAHWGDQQGRVTLAIYPTEVDKDANTNALSDVSWDIRAEAQVDELGRVISPPFAEIFGLDPEHNAIDSRKQMYLFIRGLPEYANATDLLP